MNHFITTVNLQWLFCLKSHYLMITACDRANILTDLNNKKCIFAIQISRYNQTKYCSYRLLITFDYLPVKIGKIFSTFGYTSFMDLR